MKSTKQLLLFSCQAVSDSFVNSLDCSPPGSSVHGIFQVLAWGGLPFPSPKDLPDPGIEPTSPALPGGFFTAQTLRKPILCRVVYICHPNPFYPHFPSRYPYVCSLHLCLYFWFANKFIYTIFLDSTH